MGKIIKWAMFLISFFELFIDKDGKIPNDFIMIILIFMFLGSIFWIIYDWYEDKSAAQKQNIKNTGRALDIILKLFGK